MCTFCAIANDEVASHRPYEDEAVIAFLDHRPLFPGHTLVIPRKHHETLPDLPADLIGPYFSAVQRLAAAIPQAMDATGSFVAINNIVSQSVPHLHAHVVPRRPKDGLRGFFWPRTRYEGGDEEMASVAAAIRGALGAGG
jgi:histidine triad (HIT) family protein